MSRGRSSHPLPGSLGKAGTHTDGVPPPPTGHSPGALHPRAQTPREQRQLPRDSQPRSKVGSFREGPRGCESSLNTSPDPRVRSAAQPPQAAGRREGRGGREPCGVCVSGPRRAPDAPAPDVPGSTCGASGRSRARPQRPDAQAQSSQNHADHKLQASGHRASTSRVDSHIRGWLLAARAPFSQVCFFQQNIQRAGR